jgi:hypothetical protein
MQYEQFCQQIDTTNKKLQKENDAAIDKLHHQIRNRNMYFEQLYKLQSSMIFGQVFSKITDGLKKIGFEIQKFQFQSNHYRDEVDYSKDPVKSLFMHCTVTLTGRRQPWKKTYLSSEEKRRKEKVRNDEEKFKEATGLRLNINPFSLEEDSFSTKERQEGEPFTALVTIYYKQD